MADPKLSKGMKLQIEMGSPLTFNTIPRSSQVSLSEQNGEIPATHLLSTAQESLADFAEITVTASYQYDPDDSVHAELLAARKDGIDRDFKIVFEQSSDYEIPFTAKVMSVERSGQVGALLQGSITLKVQGELGSEG